MLTRNPQHYASMGFPLDQLISAKEASPKQSAALKLNLPFASFVKLHHHSMEAHYSSRNPVIVRRILEPLESND